MPVPSCTEEQFIELMTRLGSCKKVADAIGVNERNVHHRRSRIEKRLGIALPAWASPLATVRTPIHYALDNHPAIRTLQIANGTVLIVTEARKP